YLTLPHSQTSLISGNVAAIFCLACYAPSYCRGIGRGAFTMKRLRFLVSLTNNDNDYQIEQAKSAEETARRLGVDTQIIYSANDSVTQSTQLLNVVQAAPQLRPDAIIFEPVGATALPQVARASAAANVGWVILNREATYVSDLRRQFKVPIFCV